MTESETNVKKASSAAKRKKIRIEPRTRTGAQYNRDGRARECTNGLMIKSPREEITRALFERQSPSSRNKSNPKVQMS